MGKPAKSTADEPLLNLDTLVVRPSIVIDGKRYEILAPEELSVVDSHRFMIWGKKLEALDTPEAGEDAGSEMEQLFNEIAPLVMVGVPVSVQEKLKGTQKRQVVEVFTALLLGHKAGAVAAIAKAIGLPMGMTANLSIGGSSSPNSSASTEGTQTGGSAKPQSD